MSRNFLSLLLFVFDGNCSWSHSLSVSSKETAINRSIRGWQRTFEWRLKWLKIIRCILTTCRCQTECSPRHERCPKPFDQRWEPPKDCFPCEPHFFVKPNQGNQLQEEGLSVCFPEYEVLVIESRVQVLWAEQSSHCPVKPTVEQVNHLITKKRIKCYSVLTTWRSLSWPISAEMYSKSLSPK